MAKLKFEIDCTKEAPTVHNMTEQPLNSLTPYLYGFFVKGADDVEECITVEEPQGADFKVIKMTNIKMDQAKDDETEVKVYFKAQVEFNLDFDPDDEYGCKYYSKLLDEAEWSVDISSNTIGFETSDGNRDNDSADGIWEPVKIKLKKL